MIIRPLSELQTANEFVRRLTPHGLNLSGMLTSERAAELQQELISRAALIEEVPEAPRRAFERLRTLHSYGVLCFEAYSAVCDLAPQTIELAVRERFITHFNGIVPIVTADGESATAEARTVGELVKHLRSTKSKLRPDIIENFEGGFRQLLAWARRSDYLSGQRARLAERDFVDRRNRRAHPDYQSSGMPNMSTREIYDLAEIINRLWGHSTPGGRLYPAPVRRQRVVLAVHDDGTVSSGGTDGLAANRSSLRSAQVLVVQAWADDPGLLRFDERLERTQIAADRLWGPGPFAESSAWLESHSTDEDEADVIDRWFVVLDRGPNSIVIRRSVFESLEGTDRDGTWAVIVADRPRDALMHVTTGHGARQGDCKMCPAHGLAYGAWAVALEATKESQELSFHVGEAMHRMPGGLIDFE